MKRVFAAVAALWLCVWLTLSVSAAQVTLDAEKVGLEIPDGFTVVQNTQDDIRANAEFIKTLGHSTTSFGDFMQESGLLLFAATADNQRQVQLAAKSTDFSGEIEELAALATDEASLNTAVERLVTVGSGETLCGISQVDTGTGRLFIKIEKLIDASVDYSCMQYVTITSGKVYSLMYYNFGGGFTDAERAEMQAIFESLTLPGAGYQTGDDGRTDILIIVVGVLMVVAVLFAVGVAISLMVELIRRRVDSGAEDVKIKRRRL